MTFCMASQNFNISREMTSCMEIPALIKNCEVMALEKNITFNVHTELTAAVVYNTDDHVEEELVAAERAVTEEQVCFHRQAQARASNLQSRNEFYQVYSAGKVRLCEHQTDPRGSGSQSFYPQWGKFYTAAAS
jgi:hypothetical protein